MLLFPQWLRMSDSIMNMNGCLNSNNNSNLLYFLCTISIRGCSKAQINISFPKHPVLHWWWRKSICFVDVLWWGFSPLHIQSNSFDKTLWPVYGLFWFHVILISKQSQRIWIMMIWRRLDRWKIRRFELRFSLFM